MHGSFLSPGWQTCNFWASTSSLSTFKNHFCAFFEKRRGTPLRHSCPSKQPKKTSLRTPARRASSTKWIVRSDTSTGVQPSQTRNPLGQPDAPLRSKRHMYSFTTLLLVLALLCNICGSCGRARLAVAWLCNVGATQHRVGEWEVC
jgi:hypothetical protein